VVDLVRVLVYFDSVQRRTAQRTVALLAEKFVFNLDLLLYSAVSDLEEWKQLVSGEVRVLRAQGPFEQAIVRACAAMSYDLVIAVPNDRRGVLRMLLGSRIGRLVGEAPATIWIPRNDTTQLRRIVVGISGGPQSEQDAQLAARLAMAYDARLELVHAVSQLPLFYTTFDEFHEMLQNDERIAAMAPGVVELRRIYMLLKDAGVSVEMTIRSGAVLDVLAAVCSGEGKRPPADLLVIGAHTQGGFGGTDYLENMAEEITESVPCPTLVVHAESDWSDWKIMERNSTHEG
jgi:nucleotide-binding universal stress UspA family protein